LGILSAVLQLYGFSVGWVCFCFVLFLNKAFSFLNKQKSLAFSSISNTQRAFILEIPSFLKGIDYRGKFKRHMAWDDNHTLLVASKVFEER